MSASHEALLDDVALYALGTLPEADAARVRKHIEHCPQCRAEYEALSFAPRALALSARNAQVSDLLKARIMKQIREEPDAAAASQPQTPQSSAVSPRKLAMPAYLLAAACLAIAVLTSVIMIRSMHDAHDSQLAIVRLTDEQGALKRQLRDEQLEVADLASGSAARKPVTHGTLVRTHNRLYLALHDLSVPSTGHVYQAWTLHKGARDMTPSVTFMPDRNGDAVVNIPADADATSAVAVSVEPEGGSKAPTTKPVLVSTVD